jgi:hypothetical protein
MQRLRPRTDIVWLPVEDMPPAELGLVLRRGNDNALVRELVRFMRR